MSGMDENLELVWPDPLSLEMEKLRTEEGEAQSVREGGRTKLGSHGLSLVLFLLVIFSPEMRRKCGWLNCSHPAT